MNAISQPARAAAERTPSYYTASIHQETDYPSLQGEIAVELAEHGLQVALVEPPKIGWGTSGRSGGQVTGSLSGEGAMRKHIRAPFGDALGNPLLMAGMWYYQLLEKLR